METRQQLLEISADFLSAVQEALSNPDSASSPSSNSPISSLIESTRGLDKLEFLHGPLHTGYDYVKGHYPFAEDSMLNLAITFALEKLKFNSERKIDKKVITYRIKELERTIAKEIELLPCRKQIECLINYTNPHDTALNLSLIGPELLTELAEQNIEDVDNPTYKKAGALATALSHIVKMQLEQDLSFEEQASILAFWINTTSESNKISDSHSIAAILPVLISHLAQLSTETAFQSLPAAIKKSYSELRKKYDPAKNNPDQIFKDYKTATIPHLGNIQQLAINNLTAIMTDKSREKALTNLKEEIISARDRAAKHTKKVRRKTISNAFDLIQTSVRSASQSSDLNASSSELPVTARSLEVTSSSLFFSTGMQRSKSEHSTPQASPQPKKKKK